MRQTARLLIHTQDFDVTSTLMLTLAAVLFAALIVAVVIVLTRRGRPWQRNAELTMLLELADQLEADLKTCRAELAQAHAVMSLNPDQPAASEQNASEAIHAGLRALLQQRLWIRDQAARASKQELNAAAQSMRDARTQLQPLMQALSRAQQDLDSAMREHIRRESDA